MKRILGIILLSVCTVVVTAQELHEIHYVHSKIDSLQYKLQDFRDSVRLEVKVYRDSLREARRHAYDNMPHDLRIGWGDQMFETLIWRDRGYYRDLPGSYEASYDENYRYTQHWFVEYLYNFNYCLYVYGKNYRSSCRSYFNTAFIRFTTTTTFKSIIF